MQLKWSLTTKTAAAIGITGALLVHIGGISCQQCSLQLDTSRVASQTQDIVSEIDGTNSALTELENAEHLYFLTGDAKLKHSYDLVVGRLGQHVVQLSALMMDDKAKEKDVAKLKKEMYDRVIVGQQLVGQRTPQSTNEDWNKCYQQLAAQNTLTVRYDLANLKIYESGLLMASNQRLQLASVNNIFGINMLMITVFLMLLVILLFVVRYVKERTQAEESLRRAEGKFKAVFDQTFQFTSLLSPDGTLLNASKNALDFGGLKLEDVVGRPFWEIPWWPQDDKMKERLKSAVNEAAAGNFVRFEEQQIGRFGDVTVDFSMKPVKDESGNIIMLIPEARDITERKTAESALADREARMQATVGTAPDGIITINGDGLIESANSAMQRIFGLSGNELIGRHVDNILPQFFVDEQSYFPPSLKTGESEIVAIGREMLGKRKDGMSIPVELAISALNLGDRQILTSIIRDITERKEAESRVSDFYSTVSHELRTPLTSIRTALGLMESGSTGKLPPKTEQLIRIARSECDRLIRLINDILDIRKIEAGKLSLKLQTVEAESLVEITLAGIRSLAREAGVRLITQFQATGQIRCDQDRIVQVLTNLVSNAIRFSPKDEGVIVRLERMQNGNYKYSVIDKGPGIPQDQMHKLFDKYQQLESTDGRAKGGTGLGLAITKAIVSQHGGMVGVDSEVGQGCTFWFELPEVTTVVEEDIKGPMVSAQKILLINDDDEIYDLLNGLMASGGYEMTRASTIADANQILEETTPDIVMLDVQLPDGNGMDLIASIIVEEDREEIPIVVLPGREPTLHTLGSPVLIDWLIRDFDDIALSNRLKLAVRGQQVDRIKALIVTENPSCQKNLTQRLTALGVDCIDSELGAKSVSKIRSQEPHLIILDAEVSQQQCFDVFQAIRQEKLRPIPLMVYAKNSLRSEDLDKITLAFTRHLAKSHLTEPEFLNAVRELLDGRLKTNGKVPGPHCDIRMRPMPRV